MNYNDPRPRKIYITHAPCIVCARLIVNSNIKKVIYCYPYRSEQGVELLKKRNIEVSSCHTDFE
jgi:dCMP deaminase